VHRHLAGIAAAASATETCSTNAATSSESTTYASIFPSTEQLMEMVKPDKPGQGFAELEGALCEAGLVSSDQVLLLPEEVLGVIGDMGVARARILHNYAKHLIFPLLGLRKTYEQPELAIPDLDVEECEADNEAEVE
jgi:hypothetical protein